jgi:hypothetical protein
MVSGHRSGRHLTQYNVACVYTALGDTDRAFDLLERILPHAGHELKHGWIKHDSSTHCTLIRAIRKSSN